MASASVIDVFARLFLDSEGMDEGLSEANAKMKGLGKNLTSIGKTGFKRVTLPLLAFGAIAIKTALDFEEAFLDVRRNVQGTEGDLEDLEKGIRDLAIHAPGTAIQLASVAAAAGELGVTAEEMLPFLELVGVFSQATGIQVEDAAAALLTFLQASGLAIQDLPFAANAIVALGDAGFGAEGAMLDMASSLYPLLSTLGISEDRILGISAALVRLGIDVGRGSTAVKRAFDVMDEAIEEGGRTLDLVAEAAGMTNEAFRDLHDTDPAAAFQALVAGIGQLNGSDANALLDELGFATGEAQDAILKLSKSPALLAKALDVAGSNLADTTTLTNDAAAAARSANAAFEEVKDQFLEAAAGLGTELLPMMTQLVGVVSDLIGWFTGLSETDQAVLIGLAMFAAIIPVILIGLGLMTTAVAALGVSMLPLTMIILGLAAAIILVIVIIKNWAAIVDFFQKVWDGFVAFLAASWEWIKENWWRLLFGIPGLIYSYLVPALWNAGKDLVQGLWDGVSEAWGRFVSWLDEKWESIKDKVKSIFGIHSPSTVMEEFGMNLVMGLQQGMDSQETVLMPTVGVPFAGGAGVGGGGIVFNFEVYQMPGEDSADLADRIVKMVARAQERKSEQAAFA